MPRWGCALVIGCGAAGLSLLQAGLPHPSYSDFADLYRGAVLFRHGIDPYPAVRAIHPDVALYYPLPALLLISPLTLLSETYAQAIFVGVGMGALAFAGYGSPLLIACISASAIANVITGQWSSLITASALIPVLGFLWVCKPSAGLSIAAGYSSSLSLGLALLGLLVSFAVWPGWVAVWMGALEHAVHRPLILRPGGFVLLLALLRWRRPEARVLVVLALVPQTGALYDTVPLFLIPRTKWEAYGLVALSDIFAVTAYLNTGHRSLVDALAQTWPWLFALLYLPALAMVLSRPRRAPDPVRVA